jgi:hypothetical protein
LPNISQVPQYKNNKSNNKKGRLVITVIQSDPDELKKKINEKFTYEESDLQALPAIMLKVMAVKKGLNTKGGKQKIIRRLLGKDWNINKQEDDAYLLQEALTSWKGDTQRIFLASMGQKTYGTKEHLVNRIMSNISIDKAIEVTKEYKIYLDTKKGKDSDCATTTSIEGMETTMEEDEQSEKGASNRINEINNTNVNMEDVESDGKQQREVKNVQ